MRRNFEQTIFTLSGFITFQLDFMAFKSAPTELYDFLLTFSFEDARTLHIPGHLD